MLIDLSLFIGKKLGDRCNPCVITFFSPYFSILLLYQLKLKLKIVIYKSELFIVQKSHFLKVLKNPRDY